MTDYEIIHKCYCENMREMSDESKRALFDNDGNMKTEVYKLAETAYECGHIIGQRKGYNACMKDTLKAVLTGALCGCVVSKIMRQLIK